METDTRHLGDTGVNEAREMNPMSWMPEELRGKATVNVPTAGRVLGIGRAQAYEAATRGTIPTLRIGRRVVVPVVPLLKMLGIDSAEASAPVEVRNAA
jgi:hypothetical protein